MEAGKLNCKFYLVSPQVTKNEYGEEVTTYGNKRCCQAERQIKIERYIARDAVNYATSIVLHCRMYHIIQEFDMVEYKGKLYKINLVEIDEVLKRKTLICEEAKELND